MHLHTSVIVFMGKILSFTKREILHLAKYYTLDIQCVLTKLLQYLLGLNVKR